MIFDTEYLDIITVAFFVIATYVLIVNLYTISKLRQEKKELGDDQKLLTALLGQMQGYFSKIDQGIDRISNDEARLYNILNKHQENEDKVLDAIESNQNLFLARMEKIVDIQNELLSAVENSSSKKIIQEKILPRLTHLSEMEKEEIHHAAHDIENALHELQQRIISLESILDPGFMQISNELKRGVNQNILMINQSFQQLDEQLAKRIDMLQNSMDATDKSKESVQSLNEYLSIAQENIKKLLNQSIDLSPIYKNLHTLADQVESIGHEYQTTKNDLRDLMQKMHQHEQKDLIKLRDDVEGFLVDLKVEMNDSVQMLKKEFHLGQSQVSETVKTLSERSQIKKAYGIDE